MTPQPPQHGGAVVPKRGKGLIIAGSVVMVVSLVGGIVLATMVGSGFNFSDFERDVTIDGSADRLVPGSIDFRVPELSGSATMRVGIAVESSAADRPECSIVDASGAEQPLLSPAVEESLWDMESRFTWFEVVSVAQLSPGPYTATCGDELNGSSEGVRFTVGRTASVEEIFGIFGGFFAAVGISIVAGFVFIIGLILLIVGLVQRSKGERRGTGPYPYPPGPYSQPSPYGQPQYGQPQYGQPQYGQPQYGQPQYGQPGQYGQPQYGQPGQYGARAPAAAPTSPDPSGPAPPVPPPSDGPPDSGWTVPPSKQ